MRSRLLEYLVLALLLCGPAIAQSPPAHPDDPVGGNLFPPDLVMRHQNAIGLSPDQKSYLREEIKKAQLRFTELEWDLQDAMERLAQYLAQPRIDENQTLGQLDQVLEAERAIKRAQITLMVRIKNQLDPEQQAQLRELRPSREHP